MLPILIIQIPLKIALNVNSSTNGGRSKLISMVCTASYRNMVTGKVVMIANNRQKFGDNASRRSMAMGGKVMVPNVLLVPCLREKRGRLGLVGWGRERYPRCSLHA